MNLQPPVFRPRPDIRLIAADLDGTLLDHDKELHDDFWPLVHELTRRGILFVPASGRQYQSLTRTFAGIADEAAFIAENGTWVVLRGRELFSDCISADAAHEIIRAARRATDVRPVLCGKRSAYIEDTEPGFLDEVEPYYDALQIVADLTAVTDDEFLKIALFDSVSGELNTYPAIAPFAGGLAVTVSGARWVDVMSPTANKGEGLAHLQQILGIRRDQTMAFGDYLNDCEMIDAADWSFAMANAHPTLIARARYVCPPNTENGVVRTIKSVLEIE